MRLPKPLPCGARQFIPNSSFLIPNFCSVSLSPDAPALRLAHPEDAPVLGELIELSVNTLQAAQYSEALRQAALGPVFGVDRQLIDDGTYFVIEAADGEMVACGGWSRRMALFGGSTDRSAAAGDESLLDPARDAARVRAFFVHPQWARRGLGRRLLAACESAALAQGFQRADLVATLAGEPLYAAGGYEVVERSEIPLGNGLTLPVVKMTRVLAHSLLVTESNSR